MADQLNPYEPPQGPSELPNFRDSTPNVAALERRIADLETRLANSWLAGPSFFRKILAIWGYLIVGYVMIVAVVFPISLLMEWLFFRR